MKYFISLFLLTTIFLSGCNNQNNLSLKTVVPPQSDNSLQSSSKTEKNLDILDSTDAESNDLSEDNNAAEYSIFLIALEDKGLNGKEIGCGDSVVALPQNSQKTSATNSDLLTEAFTTLLSLKNKNDADSGLTNFLPDSKLELISAEIIDGIAQVKLSGQPTSSGLCDDPRIIAQLEETANQFPGVRYSQIFINDKPLNKIFSPKG